MPDTRPGKIFKTGKRFMADSRGMTSIETAVMFGVFAIGFALVATSYLDDKESRMASNDSVFGNQVDNMVTGSISRSRRYTIRRSVLHPNKNSRCIIFSDGKKFGDC